LSVLQLYVLQIAFRREFPCSSYPNTQALRSGTLGRSACTYDARETRDVVNETG